MGAAVNRGGDDNESACKDGEQVFSEDEDVNDELYIDPGTFKNNGVSTHIMYVHALALREIKNYKASL